MPATVDPNTLATLPLFHGLPQEALSRLTRLLHRKTFAAGTTLMTAEQPGEVAYIVVSGTVKVHIEQADGSDVILAILGPGALVGELSLIEDQGRSATVETLEESTLLWLNRAAFDECRATMPEINHNLVRLLARRVRLANAQIQSLATKDVFGRVACLLLVFAELYGMPGANGDILIPLRLTQSDLGSLVGASRVRVNQVLGFYKDRKYLSIHPNFHITLHDPTALTRRCE